MLVVNSYGFMCKRPFEFDKVDEFLSTSITNFTFSNLAQKRLLQSVNRQNKSVSISDINAHEPFTDITSNLSPFAASIGASIEESTVS